MSGGTPRPAATVVLVRERADLELLLLRRSAADPAAGVLWVFPGGKVDPTDQRPGDDEIRSARRAAVREVAEEAGLPLDPSALATISRWITPPVSRRRFDTWFFAAQVAADAEVRVDGGEITGHRWLRPQDALDAHHAGELRLAPPTFVTVAWLTGHRGALAALEALRCGEEVPTFHPCICRAEDVTCILYAGDAGYADADPSRPGARHRLWMRKDGWEYERSQA